MDVFYWHPNLCFVSSSTRVLQWTLTSSGPPFSCLRFHTARRSVSYDSRVPSLVLIGGSHSV